MRKEIITLALIMFGLNTSAFTADLYDAIPPAKESFEKAYPDALYSKWETLQDGITYAVRFVNSNQSLIAYYNEEGTEIGIARIISIDTLPTKVKNIIADNYPASEVLNIQELTMEGKSVFYFDIKNNNTRYFIKVSDRGKVKSLYIK